MVVAGKFAREESNGGSFAREEGDGGGWKVVVR